MYVLRSSIEEYTVEVDFELLDSSHSTHPKARHEVPGSAPALFGLRSMTGQRTGHPITHRGPCLLAQPARHALYRSYLDHALKVPATEASRCCGLVVECDHRCPEHPEGRSGWDTGQGRFRHRQRYPHND